MDRRIVIAMLLLALTLSASIGAGLYCVADEARSYATPGPDDVEAAGTMMSGDFSPARYAFSPTLPAPG